MVCTSFLNFCGLKIFPVDFRQITALLVHFANRIIRIDKSPQELLLNVP